jgi:hypothetical protein
MALFKKLTTDGLEQSQDRLGGFSPFDTGIYTGKIKNAYGITSQQGAQGVTLVVDFAGKEYKETLYVTNKKGENFFYNKDDKTKKVPLPGFTVVDDICLIVTGEPLSAQEDEEKIVKIYDYEQKKEIPTNVPVLTALIGAEISLGIVRILENKSEKVGDDYVPTAETREINQIDKVYHPEMKMTVAEARDGKETGEFWENWETRNKGVTRDKRTLKDGAAAPGRPTRAAGEAPAAGAAATKSIFGKKKS